MPEASEIELAEFLTELSAVQDELLWILGEKRKLLARADLASMEAMQPRERNLIERLQACHQKRCALLERSRELAAPADSLQSLAASLPFPQGTQLVQRVQQASQRSRLLQHQSLTNWVLVQKTLLHLSQMLEIIATGGRPRPTYERGEPRTQGGSLVDHAA